MIQTQLANDMIALARDKAKAMGTLRNSITQGRGNVYGFAGELAAARYLEGATVHNTRDYDLILPIGVKGMLVDVKTKKVTTAPKEHYLCSVADFNTTQKCDAYLFARVKDDFSYAWLLGWLPTPTFYSRAKFYRAGELDPDGNGRWRFRTDCYNIAISKLLSMERLKEMLDAGLAIVGASDSETK